MGRLVVVVVDSVRFLGFFFVFGGRFLRRGALSLLPFWTRRDGPPHFSPFRFLLPLPARFYSVRPSCLRESRRRQHLGLFSFHLFSPSLPFVRFVPFFYFFFSFFFFLLLLSPSYLPTDLLQILWCVVVAAVGRSDRQKMIIKGGR